VRERVQLILLMLLLLLNGSMPEALLRTQGECLARLDSFWFYAQGLRKASKLEQV
jgi:hypothetical protein